MAVPSEGEDRWVELRRLRQEDDWRGALSLCSERHDPLLLWLRPTLDALHFLGSALSAEGVIGVLSIGCGSGLFEWLLASATGLRVTGVEVNREWWECKYSPPTFLPLLYQDEPDHTEGGVVADVNNNFCPRLEGEDSCDKVTPLLKDVDAALLFCYFNDMPAFLEYVARFRGRCLVVAGPGPGAPVHCQPQPFSDDIPAPWRLSRSARIGSTPDWIAIYVRQESGPTDT